MIGRFLNPLQHENRIAIPVRMKTIQPFDTPEVIIRDDRDNQWRIFTGLKRIYSIDSVSEIAECLKNVEKEIKEQGFWAAGWLSYEAAPAFDMAHVAHKSADFPLLWIALFESSDSLDNADVLEHFTTQSADKLSWLPGISDLEYAEKIAAIKYELSQGNSYQVNYTVRRDARLKLPTGRVFMNFAAEARYGAFIDTGRFSISSASPELFFEKQGSLVSCRPMKGTAARGRYPTEDLALREDLADSKKNRAENLMIVDMIRNDLGKIAEPGSVECSRLFEIEQYPTVWQMTSTVQANCDVSLVELFSALFPCASITGAPKANTMKIISKLEDRPRKVYTGTIGFVRPDLSMQFNVAIRSLLIDRELACAEYGVGGGIVWDSDAESEFRECQVKTRVLDNWSGGHHQLLETLLWEPENGYFLLDYHTRRLIQSAQYFDYPLDISLIQQVLEEAVVESSHPQRVRLLVDKKGDARVEIADYVKTDPRQAYRIVLAESPIDESNVYLFHKTTERSCYEHFNQRYPDYDDVLLYNSQDEVTESLIANLIIEVDGKQYTPPVESGLLAGTYRQFLLDRNQLEERIIHRQDLVKADHIYLANSVRKTWPVELVVL